MAKGNDPKTGTQDLPRFILTNNMITAFGWIMKWYNANQLNWNLSMVSNLCNTGEIYSFSCLEDESSGLGHFGNALTSFPPAQQSGTG
jgi:hypothetical protein